MINEDDPIALKDAARHFGFPLDSLRVEANRGRLTIYRIGGRYYTTPADIRRMVEACRVENPRRASISTREENSGLSETGQTSSALAALSATVRGLKGYSQNTSPANTSRNRVVTRA